MLYYLLLVQQANYTQKQSYSKSYEHASVSTSLYTHIFAQSREIAAQNRPTYIDVAWAV